MSAINVYPIGAVVRLDAPVSSGGSAVDPAALYLEVRPPGGPTVVYGYNPLGGVIVRTGAGAYHADIPLEEAGAWFYRWYSTGLYQGASFTGEILVVEKKT